MPLAIELVFADGGTRETELPDPFSRMPEVVYWGGRLFAAPRVPTEGLRPRYRETDPVPAHDAGPWRLKW